MAEFQKRESQAELLSALSKMGLEISSDPGPEEDVREKAPGVIAPELLEPKVEQKGPGNR